MKPPKRDARLSGLHLNNSNTLYYKASPKRFLWLLVTFCVFSLTHFLVIGVLVEPTAFAATRHFRDLDIHTSAPMVYCGFVVYQSDYVRK